MDVIRGNIPNDIKDLSFIDQLEKMGYQKASTAPSKFKSMDSIFVKKTATNHEVYACIHVYRDILIFKDSRPSDWDRSSNSGTTGGHSQEDANNHANQMNPNNAAYHSSRAK